MRTVLCSAQDNTFFLVLRENCLNNFFTSHFFLPSSNSNHLPHSLSADFFPFRKFNSPCNCVISLSQKFFSEESLSLLSQTT